MRMARAPKEQVDHLTKFLEWLEQFEEYGHDIRKFDGETGECPQISDEEAMDYIKSEFSRLNRRLSVGSCWHRVVWGYQVLHDNVCDPALDYLEFKPELAEIIAAGSPMEIPVDVHPFAVDAFQTV